MRTSLFSEDLCKRRAAYFHAKEATLRAAGDFMKAARAREHAIDWENELKGGDPDDRTPSEVKSG